MKNKKKRTIITVFLLCILLVQNVSAYTWYTVPTKDHSQPRSFEAQDIINKYDTLYIGDPDEKVIYLTFDAGYENGNVEKVLDALKEQDVKAAFFILPHIVKANTKLVERMSDEGHLVCSHSTTHRDMSKICDFESFKKEISGLEIIYRETTGKELQKYFRPPEGCFSEKTLEYAQKLGYKTVFWSLAYADWDNNNQMPCEKAENIILSRIHNGCVLLLHPTSETNAKILSDLIIKLKSEGYEFKRLDEFKR